MDIDKGLWGPIFHALYWNHRIFHVDASAEKDMLGSGPYLEPAIVVYIPESLESEIGDLKIANLFVAVGAPQITPGVNIIWLVLSCGMKIESSTTLRHFSVNNKNSTNEE